MSNALEISVTKERVNKLITDKGLRVDSVAKSAEINYLTLWKSLNGQRNFKPRELAAIAGKLDTSVDYLLGIIDDPGTVRGSDKSTSNEVGLPTIGGTSIRISNEFVDPSIVLPVGESDEQTNARQSLSSAGKSFKVIRVPIYAISACMGKGFDNEGEIPEVIDYVYLKASDIGTACPEEPFGFEAEGHSMSPKIEDGERVIINPNIPPGRGDICLIRFRDRGYLRDSLKYYFRSGDNYVFKASETSGIPPITVTPEDIAEGDAIIVGRVDYIDRGEKV